MGEDKYCCYLLMIAKVIARQATGATSRAPLSNFTQTKALSDHKKPRSQIETTLAGIGILTPVQ